MVTIFYYKSPSWILAALFVLKIKLSATHFKTFFGSFLQG